MKKHTKIYMNHFGHGDQSFVPCEYCGRQAVDVHHLEPRGMGGSKTKDYIENLMGLCRECHNKAEAEPKFNDLLKKVHKDFIGNVNN
tara:strand:+ start:739 stop:999 length:261 start_codon:yes stop_codon:yes gene_type:complete